MFLGVPLLKRVLPRSYYSDFKSTNIIIIDPSQSRPITLSDPLQFSIFRIFPFCFSSFWWYDIMTNDLVVVAFWWTRGGKSKNRNCLLSFSSSFFFFFTFHTLSRMVESKNWGLLDCFHHSQWFSFFWDPQEENQ